MDNLDLPEPLSSSSSLSSLVSAMDLSTDSDELSEIIELPRLESGDEKREFVFMDSVDGWMYQPPWFQKVQDFDGYVVDQFGVPECGFESLVWN